MQVMHILMRRVMNLFSCRLFGMPPLTAGVKEPTCLNGITPLNSLRRRSAALLRPNDLQVLDQVPLRFGKEMDDCQTRMKFTVFSGHSPAMKWGIKGQRLVWLV